MEKSFTIIKTFTNAQLRSLVKEMHEIGKLNAPANAELSEDMKVLFEAESDFRNWSDKYYYVNIIIDSEVKKRIVDNSFNSPDEIIAALKKYVDRWDVYYYTGSRYRREEMVEEINNDDGDWVKWDDVETVIKCL